MDNEKEKDRKNIEEDERCEDGKQRKIGKRCG